MEYQTIIFKKENNTGIIQLHRPQRMNAVTEAMYQEIQDVLFHVAADENSRALVITGSVREKNGEKKQAFCAGADLKDHSAGKRNHAQKREYIELAHETTRLLYQFPKPIIAAINGPARGAGAELAINCDFVLMAQEASIAFPEIGLGTFIGGGVTQHLPALVGLMKAKELVYTGRVINGPSAVALGLALECVPIEELMERALQLANELAEKAPISLRFAKKRLQESSRMSLETVLALETSAILTCMDSEDWQEGADAFVEKRKPVYKGK